MTDRSTERFLWMIGVLDVKPSERLLEIGCGSGVAVHQIARTLTTGKIIAVDRSQAMLDKAITRNKEFIREGKVELIQKDLSMLPTGAADCDKVFACNVNLFWTKNGIAKEISVIQSHIKPGGHLYLFYQPPKDECKTMTEIVARNLKSHGCLVTTILYKPESRSCCIICRPRQ